MVEHDMLQVDDCMVNGEAENKEGYFLKVLGKISQ